MSPEPAMAEAFDIELVTPETAKPAPAAPQFLGVTIDALYRLDGSLTLKVVGHCRQPNGRIESVGFEARANEALTAAFTAMSTKLGASLEAETVAKLTPQE